MSLELKEVMVTPGSRLDLSESFVFDDVSAEGEGLRFSPVSVCGTVTNTGGLVELRYTAEFKYSKPCDRCLVETEKSAKYEFTHTLAASGQEDDWGVIITPEYNLDLFNLVRDDILLELPTRHLCSENCQGLCPVCGQNLNEKLCGCRKVAPDPRMAVLDELLQD